MTTITYEAKHGVLLTTSETAWLGLTAEDDITPQGKDLTVNGTITQSPVITAGASIQYTGFSGSNYLSLAYDSELNYLDTGTNGLSIACWVNIGAVSDVDTILDRGNVGGTGVRYTLAIHSDGKLKLTITDGTNTIVTNGVTDLSDSGWTHIVGSWNGTTETALFVNGTYHSGATGTAPSGADVGNEVLHVGLDTTGANPCAQGLSLVRLYNIQLSSQQVLRQYNAETVMFVDGVGYSLYGETLIVSFPASVLNRSGNAVRTATTSIGGNRQIMYDREEVTWNVTTSEVTGAAVIEIQLMIQALLDGRVFTFDAYDDDKVIFATLNSDSYTATRLETSDYFMYSMTVRQE